LDSDASESFNVCPEWLADATARDLFCFLLQFPRPIYGTRVSCAGSRRVFLCSADEDLMFFISPRQSVNCKGLDASQHRCKRLCMSAQG